MLIFPSINLSTSWLGTHGFSALYLQKKKGEIVSSTFPPSRISTFSHTAVGGRIRRRRRERNRYEVKEEEEKRRSRDAKSFQNEKMPRLKQKSAKP